MLDLEAEPGTCRLALILGLPQSSQSYLLSLEPRRMHHLMFNHKPVYAFSQGCCSLLLLLFRLFCDPMGCDQQVPLSMGSPRQEHWRGLPFPSPGDLLDPGIKLESPALVSRFFTPEPLGKPHHTLGEHSFPESEAGLLLSVMISPPSPQGCGSGPRQGDFYAFTFPSPSRVNPTPTGIDSPL